MADEAQFYIDGKPYPIPSSFTFGECRQIQRITGGTVGEFGRAITVGSEDADVLVALLWVVMHREDKTVTVEQVEELDITAIVDQPAGEEEQAGPPADAADAAAETPTPSTGSATASPDAAESSLEPTLSSSGEPG